MPRRSVSSPDSAESALLSIGALAAATGIPAETIRTWERRYGFPVAERKPSGHRVYPLETVPRLRRISEALARGHRAAEVLPASERALEALLASLPVASPTPRETGATLAATASPEALLAAVRTFDAEALKRVFQMDWARLGPIEFMEQRAAPFLTAVGRGWAAGDLDIRHEHFGSAVLGDFLRSARQPLDDRAAGPVVSLATLPGELHGLGLQMSALVFALAGWRVLMLGVNTPPAQLVALAREAPIGAVALSCVHAADRKWSSSMLTLRRRLPRHVPLLVGGTAAAELSRQAGIIVMPDLRGLDRWLRAFPRRSAP